MSDFAFVGIDHVTVTAPEELMEDVLSWYRDILGFSSFDKPEGTRSSGGWFRVGNQEIHVSVDPHNPPHSSHFGLVVDDYAEVVEALRSAGCHIEQASLIPGRHRFFTRDPAGNKIEIVSFDGAGEGDR
ncbi:MAG TPA: VOC family protein [Actinomycetota bacterium]|nr:VOC family protein [Actinomycetota bacterium]